MISPAAWPPNRATRSNQAVQVGLHALVPPTHAHWYAAHLPFARLEMLPGELHLSMCFRSAARIQEACRELAARVLPAARTEPLLAEFEAG